MINKNSKIAVIGAGFAGQNLADDIIEKGIFGRIEFFLDDDKQKIGTEYKGIPVFGPIDSCSQILHSIDEVILAIPGIKRQRLLHIYSMLKSIQSLKIRILPNVSQIIEGRAHITQTRAIHLQDLLPRETITISLTKSLNYLQGKRVLITGAGGSIGSELARQLLSGGASRIYLFDHAENSLYEIDKELRLMQQEGIGEKAQIVPIIGELQDQSYVEFIINRLKADVIFHCAAHKHVPLMEQNPVEVIKNNVFSSSFLIDAAVKYGTEKLVLISTDKAVDPSCIYGASKKIAEELFLSTLSQKTELLVVRFGNVLGSQGSIIPLFTKQIHAGEPVTITDERMERYFMTIPEAASLVLQTGGVGETGTLYILDMGKPVKIIDLAKALINMYGFEPGKDVPLKITGIRPGEKIHENLFSSQEEVQTTEYKGILKIISRQALEHPRQLLDELFPICFFQKDQKSVFRNKKVLREILSKYIPSIIPFVDDHEF